MAGAAGEAVIDGAGLLRLVHERRPGSLVGPDLCPGPELLIRVVADAADEAQGCFLGPEGPNPQDGREERSDG